MAKSKKIISLLLSVIMIMSVWGVVPFYARAQEDVADTAAQPSATITAGGESQSFHVGDTIKYTYYMNASDISPNGRICGVDAAVYYDESILKFTGDRDEICPNLMDPKISSAEDMHNCIKFNDSNVGRGFKFDSDDKALVELTFEVIAEGSTDVYTTIETLYAVYDTEVAIFIQQGEVTEKGAPAVSDELVHVNCPHPAETETTAPETQDPTQIATQAPETQTATTEPVPADKAVVTLYALDGKFETKTFDIGDEFTVYTMLNSSVNDDGKISTVSGEQYYTASVLKRMDALDEEDLIDDVETVFPILAQAHVIGNGMDEGALYFSGSNPSKKKPYMFDSDGSKLIVTRYKVTAGGTAEVRTNLKTLALSDDYLTRVVDRYVVQPGMDINFYSSFTDTVAPVTSSYKMKLTDKTELRYEYSVSDGDFTVQTATAAIKVLNPELLEGGCSVYVDNRKTTDYTIDGDTFTIHAGDSDSGSISIVFDRIPNTKLYTTARMRIDTDKGTIISSVDKIIYNEFITLDAPEVVGSEIIHVNGETLPGMEITVFVDDTEVKKVTADRSGAYREDIEISEFLMPGHIYHVKAEYTDSEGVKHAALRDVKYDKDYPELEEFTVTYRGRTYDLLSDGKLNITFIVRYWGGNYPFTFNVKFKNPIDKYAYITSTRNGIVKFMELKKVSEDGEYMAEGYFEPYEDDYIPGVLEVVVTEKEPIIENGTAVFEDPICPYRRDPFKWSIDPSGYVYAGIDSDRVYNAEVTAYCIPFDSDTDDDSFWDSPDESRRVKWDASEYSQQNPLYTTLDGDYAWDVPEGWWQLEITKDGYEKAVTEWMTVLPPQLDVNINLKTSMAPEIQSAYIEDGDIIITFKNAMKVDSLKNLTLKDPLGNNVAYSVSYDAEKGENGEDLVKKYIIKKDDASADYYTVEFIGSENYSGIKGDMTAKAENAVILGDADVDGKVTIADATAIQRTLIKLGDNINRKAADIDGDGIITITDASFIQRFVIKAPIPYSIGDSV